MAYFMYYLLTLVLLSTIPLLVAFKVAKRSPSGGTAIGRRAVIWVVVGGGSWFMLSWLARGHAETDYPMWAVAEWFAHTGRWYVFGAITIFFSGIAIWRQHVAVPRRQVVLGLCVEVMLLWLVVWRTMPLFIFLDDEVTRDERGFIRQTIEYTCAPVSLGNLLEMDGNIQVSERYLSQISGTTVEGTTMAGILRAGRDLGLEVSICKSITLEELDELGAPAFVQILTLPSVRHAVLFAGMDDSHVQLIDPAYGLYEITRLRFAEIWYGKTIKFQQGVVVRDRSYAGHHDGPRYLRRNSS